MKNHIKRIAAIAAAVICAVPMTGSLSASAATQYKMHRTYVISKKTNSGIKSLKSVYTRKNGLIDMGCRMGSLGGNSSTWTTAQKTEFNWQPKNNRCDEVGVVVSFTNKTTNSAAPKYMGSVKNTYTLVNSKMTDPFDVQNVVVGDITSELSGARLTNSYDGLTAMDALKVQIFVRDMSNCTYNSKSAVKVEKYLRSANYDSLNKNTICGLLASDINNDGYVTETDATAILAVKAGRYTDLTVFNGVSESKMRTMTN